MQKLKKARLVLEDGTVYEGMKSHPCLFVILISGYITILFHNK